MVDDTGPFFHGTKADLDVVVYEFRWNSVYERAEDGNYYWKSIADRTPVYTQL